MAFLRADSKYAITARVRRFEEKAMSCAGNGIEAEKYIVCSGGLALRHQMAVTISAMAKAETVIQASLSLVFPEAADGAVPAVCPPPSAIHFNSNSRSRAVCQRSSGSFARHLLTTRSSARGAIGCKDAMGCGSEERMAAIKLARLFPVNAGLPVAISYITPPSENMS